MAKPASAPIPANWTETVDISEREENDRLIQPCEAAVLTGMSARSLRRYNTLGLITARKTPGGHRRYWLSDILALLVELRAVA